MVSSLRERAAWRFSSSAESLFCSSWKIVSSSGGPGLAIWVQCSFGELQWPLTETNVAQATGNIKEFGSRSRYLQLQVAVGQCSGHLPPLRSLPYISNSDLVVLVIAAYVVLFFVHHHSNLSPCPLLHPLHTQHFCHLRASVLRLIDLRSLFCAVVINVSQLNGLTLPLRTYPVPFTTAHTLTETSVGREIMASGAASKRLTKEYANIQKNPPPYIQAHPSENNILEWHYILDGAPSTPVSAGLRNKLSVLI